MNSKRPWFLYEGQRNATFGRDQQGVFPLPGAIDDSGLVMVEFEPTAEELAAILDGARVRLWVWTNNRGLQPMNMCVVSKDGNTPYAGALDTRIEYLKENPDDSQ
jgi:hypothetical protein